MEKKTYEEPSIKKVEFDFRERIAASACMQPGAGCQDFAE